MRRILGIVAALVLAMPARAEVRTVFVGIDQYAYSNGKPGNVDPSFHDLGGAVNDVMLMRRVLAKSWGVALDTLGGPCPAAPAVSMTLLNQCATRRGIIGALTGQIAAASPGDTVLFYYSGHGSQALDRERSQAGGKNGTIVPHDGRGGTVADILDVDLKRLIDAAEARGVNVVTIADSCNAGTLIRDLRGGGVRFANPDPTPPGAPNDIFPPPPRAHDAKPYRVLLAASADGEVTREIGVGPDRHGVFTTALATALTELPKPSYADLAAEVRRRVGISGDQSPKAEGALPTAFLGRDRASVRIFEAKALGTNSAGIAGGSLAGVTPGSSFGLYPGRGAPDAGMRPVAMGVVQTVRPGDAEMSLDTPIGSGAFVAVEAEHVYAGPPLRIRIDGGSAGQRQVIADAVRAARGVDLVTATPTHVFGIKGDHVQLLRAADGSAIGSGFAASGAAVARDAADSIAKLARFNAVMALRNDVGARLGAIDFSLRCADPKQHPALAIENGTPVGYVGDTVDIGFTNLGARSMYAYLIALDHDLEIVPLYADETPLGAGETLFYPGGSQLNGTGGLAHLLLLLTDARTETAALQQEGVRALAAPRNDLERLLLAARNGDGGASRDITRVNAWGGMIADLMVKPADARKGGARCRP